MSKVDRFVIYLPQSAVPKPMEINVPAMKIGKFKVTLATNNKGKGRLTSLGIGLKGDRKPKQMWRMDYHPIDPHHNPAGDVKYFSDYPFHYHVNKAPHK